MIRPLLSALIAFALPAAAARPLPGTMIICTRDGLKSIPAETPRDNGPPCAHSFCETRRKPSGLP